MHTEKVKYFDAKTRTWGECEADTFDTVLHINKGTKHALRDIERLLAENNKRLKENKYKEERGKQ